MISGHRIDTTITTTTTAIITTMATTETSLIDKAVATFSMKQQSEAEERWTSSHHRQPTHLCQLQLQL